MGYLIDADYDYLDLEETGLIRRDVGAASLEKTLRDPILFFWCLPVSICGALANVLVLWIWLTVKTRFKYTVYLFRALALADFLYVSSYPFVRFYRFHNIYIQKFFEMACYSHRTISLHITLMLAVARFIKLYYPLRVQKILSHSRLRLGIVITIVLNVILIAILLCRDFYLPKKDWYLISLVFRKMLSLIVPVVAQNVLMIMVVLKLRRFSKKVAPSSNAVVLKLGERGQTICEQKKQVQPPLKSQTLSTVQTGHLAREHRETTCDAGPQDPLTPVAREETVQSDPTAEGQLKTKLRSVDCEAELETVQEEDPLLKTEPQKVKKRHSVGGLESGLCDEKTITLQPVSASSKLLSDIDSRIIYVVFAICASTFVSQLLCAIVRILNKKPYGLDILKTPYLTYACSVVILINHGINLVFYLFISTFRQAFLSKCRRLVDRGKSASFVSVKATYPTMGSERTALDSSNREMQSPMTSEVQLSSRKFAP